MRINVLKTSMRMRRGSGILPGPEKCREPFWQLFTRLQTKICMLRATRAQQSPETSSRLITVYAYWHYGECLGFTKTESSQNVSHAPHPDPGPEFQYAGAAALGIHHLRQSGRRGLRFFVGRRPA